MSEFNPLVNQSAVPKLEELGRELRRLDRRQQMISGAFLLGVGLGVLFRSRSYHRQFVGQTALVTGGTRGLGLQLVREFADRGAKVVFCARHADEIARAEELLSKEGYSNVRGMVCDLARPDAPSDLIGRIAVEVGPVDILVNNAGTIQVLPFVDSEEKAFHDCLDVFLHAPLRLSKELLPGMLAAGQGTIVNVTSVGGQIPAPHLVPYNCGKAAMVALSEGMSVELDGYGVKVLTVKPGLMRTGSHRNAMFGGHSSQEYAWFSRAALSPGLALSVSSAAKQIVDAVSSGKRTLSLGWEAKWGPLFHQLFPETSLRLTSAIEKMLPDSGGTDDPQMGEMIASEAPPLGALMQRLEEQAMAKHQAARYSMAAAHSNGHRQ